MTGSAGYGDPMSPNEIFDDIVWIGGGEGGYRKPVTGLPAYHFRFEHSIRHYSIRVFWDTVSEWLLYLRRDCREEDWEYVSTFLQLPSHVDSVSMKPTKPLWQRNATRQAWLNELERRMAQADNPLTVSEEQKADVWEALIAHSNEKLPEGHPSKITAADLAALARIRGSLAVLADVDRLVTRLRRILPPDSADDTGS